VRTHTRQDIERQGLTPTIWPARYQGSTAAGRTCSPRPEETATRWGAAWGAARSISARGVARQSFG
jgi:hypothetical protein